MSARKREKRQEMSERALNIVRTVAGATAINEVLTGTPSSSASRRASAGGIKSVSEATSMAAEDDKGAAVGAAAGTTTSMRIKDMASVATRGMNRGPVLDRIIAKSNDDLRQEVFTMQLLQFLRDVWTEAKVPVYLKTYRILSTSQQTGILEVITNADSIDGVSGPPPPLDGWGRRVAAANALHR